MGCWKKGFACVRGRGYRRVEQLVVEMQREAAKGQGMAEIYIRTAPDADYAHMVKLLAMMNAAGIQTVYLDEFSARSSAIPASATRYSLSAN